LPPRFDAERLAALPRPLAHESARRWLIAQGSDAGELCQRVLDRLVEMAADLYNHLRKTTANQITIPRTINAPAMCGHTGISLCRKPAPRITCK